MAKITALEAKTYQGKPSGFKVTLSDGTTGNLQEKESDKGLRVGDEVIVRLIPYTSKAGVTSNLLGLRLNQGGTPQAYTPPPTPAPQPAQQVSTYTATGKLPVKSFKSVQELKAEASVKALEFVITAFVAERVDDKQIEEFQKRARTILWNDLDEIFSEG